MKNKSILRVIAVSLFFALTLTACACKHEFDSGAIVLEPTCTTAGMKTYTCGLCKKTRDEVIPVAEHMYESQVTKEPTFEMPGVATFTCTVCGNSYSESIPVKEKKVVVTVTDKINVPKDIYKGYYSDYVKVLFDVTNEGDKDILALDGILSIQDLFGKEMFSIRCDFTDPVIPAGSTVQISDKEVRINEFLPEETKFYNEKFEDLKFSFEVSNIVYVGERAELPVYSPDMPVTVAVTDKQNIPENMYQGIYSDYVLFVLDVKNTSSKDIKGVQGTLHVFDLFGKEILSFGCDLTGENIPANSSVVFDDYTYDINQFIPEQLKFYTRSFAELGFAYEATSIVYADGTTQNA